jgi:hypothetical protein
MSRNNSWRHNAVLRPCFGIRLSMVVPYARHQFPPCIIQHAVWLYVRFSQVGIWGP